MLTFSALSTIYVKATVSAKIAGAAVDPTSSTVTIAFVAAGTGPVSDDFATASWETATVDSVTTYYARRLAALTAGRYDMWVQVVRSPETAVEYAGQFVVV